MPLASHIAVVIPCRDDAPYLDACLAALAAQTRPADRVIVVDNASTDASAAVAARHAAVVLHEPTIGIWPAVARGYDEAVADADIIARLDADSRPHPDWIARIERAFASDPSLGVLTGGAEFYGGTPLQNYLGERWYIGGGHYWIRRWLGIPLVFGSNFAMRARVWERVRDQVDRGNAGIHDDLDLTIRLRAADGVRYDPQLRMPVSARPVQTLSGLSRRVFKVVSTFAASWPEGAAWRRSESAGWRRSEGAGWRRSEQAGTDAATGAEWIRESDDWAPEYGR
ncbi:glycosyltransferase [Microbacterium sp. M3]|uniref:Glycosyltransferase n=1 Tax=Microbacterium arthrosphaerae TaxID=792652 RepID=A0ABU4H2T7_9MICO|nr:MULTISPECIES: glycosyltransferase [Microbacterium]MDW4572224.1 glycosyltransferase [Microbacterium arthrosphaerae]MDW7606079.1 glycosyltransferase [Microbacterium sp. M3]